ncbi:NAD(+) diphosphatase [Pseudoalteromonas luteoviolacea]|nr:NAD(+) diphosphatase [Pseudoalteromonas luteoviolacea]AOT07980.1 NADH pyrophosphatase [Pseudoalteromonas luteoviolacea]AOT12896.1 NADH pyrophosphatase [Pseudoalteromonas luteoviolacea]AOT17809.1 NADH pyrophosphatase [Pseudoalteromonas luteoviolacea]
MLYYTQMTLDRASAQRKDKNWLLTQYGEKSRWLLIHNDQNLFTADLTELAFIRQSQIEHLDRRDAVFLGKDEQFSYFALDVSSIDLSELQKQLNVCTEAHTEGQYRFADMRKVGPKLERVSGSIGVLARGLSYWHKTHCYCGRCGHKNIPVEAGHARLCTNKACKHMTFPRTDPAVIMLVTHTFKDGVERCLLGRQEAWPEGVYSTLAGFVDPGETLEQAVAREVEEEAGVIVDDVQYLASQPWPFPSSLMLGFIATAKTTDIFVEQDELEQAHWFSRADLDTFGQWGDDAPGLKLTRPDSISRFLVEHWRQLPEKE